MDHWPTPARPARPLTKVKIHRDVGWPLGQVDFHTYPESQGWWKARSDDVDFITPGDRPLQRPSYAGKSGANEFLQKWAYFGLLSEVMQAPVFGAIDPPQAINHWVGTLSWLMSFVSAPQQSSSSVMDSSDLPISLRNFISKTRVEHTGDLEREGRAWRCIQTTSSWLKRMREYETPPFDPDLIMAVEFLISDLARTVHLAYESNARVRSESGEIKSYTLARHPEAPLMYENMSSTMFERRMLEDGWCTSNMRRLFTKAADLSSQYFLSMLDRPRPHLRHDQGCSEDYCRHWMVDMASYTTAHVCDRGDCCWVTVPMQRMEEILASGEDAVPVVVPGVTDTTDDGRVVVRLEAGPETEYVAISRVWSDGLGNTTANEIPICQFERLSKMVQEAWGNSKICFWLDTLCFPYPTSPAKEAYQQALEKMRTTYEQAELVLVLDSYLLGTQYDPSATDNHELALRVLCSEWNARLWTYQEGQLAKRLKFVFGSTAVETPFAILDHPISANDGIWSGFQSKRVVRPASMIDTYSRGKTGDLRKIYADLSHRATSVAEDEGLCLANLLGIDSRVVTRVPSKERMEQLWRHADPFDGFTTLFRPCQRLEVEGLGWTPKSLLTRVSTPFAGMPVPSEFTFLVVTREGGIKKVEKRTTAIQAKLDPSGLMFKCFYVLLSGLNRPISRRFVCGGSGMDWYQVDLHYDTEGRAASPGGSLDLFPLPPSHRPLGPADVLFLLFPHVQERLTGQQLLPENMAVLCRGKIPGRAPSQYGWQDHLLAEVRSLGIVTVSRCSKSTQESQMTTLSPVAWPDGTVYYLWEQIENQDGTKAYSARWRAKTAPDTPPEEATRIRASIPKGNDPRRMPPQRLLIGNRRQKM
ncbi:hypothetical protein LZ31DRAFT_550104 [Colletotrichum somersetense]|nr:hypothetical protein LZ31DRAFT_550104 [Colletotrichum somersetense]